LYYAYDPEGNLASETCINKTGKQTFAVYYEYSNKKLVQETLVRPDGSQYLTEYRYDENSRLLEIQHRVKAIESGVATVRMDYIISRTGMK